MELTHEFTVGVPVERAWDVLTDLERIVPCVPGASLREVEGDEYRGAVELAAGSVATRFEGTATFVELDRGARRAVLLAEGREVAGQAEASATVTATLAPVAAGTTVRVATDLAVTGAGVDLGFAGTDVGAGLLDQFVACLAADVLATAAASASPVPPLPEPVPAADPAPVGGSGVVDTSPGPPGGVGDDTDAVAALLGADDPTDEIPVVTTAAVGAVAEPLGTTASRPTADLAADDRTGAPGVPTRAVAGEPAGGGRALALAAAAGLAVLWLLRRRRRRGERR